MMTLIRRSAICLLKTNKWLIFIFPETKLYKGVGVGAGGKFPAGHLCFSCAKYRRERVTGALNHSQSV